MTTTRPIFVAGYPGSLGGANTECWHTVRLWRQLGLEVRLIPTWSAGESWQRRLEQIGCTTILCRPDQLQEVPHLRGGTVVSFCNSQFLRQAAAFRRLDCRIVWLNCMTWLFPEERRHYRSHGPFDRYVFQSRYQQQELQPQLARFGVRPEQCHLIRGAFCLDEFPFRPLAHAPGTPLVLGRLSRPAADKYARHTWELYGRIGVPRRVRLMGWAPEVERKLGSAPAWAECLTPDAEDSSQFLRSLHCLMPINGGAAENWPRAGLEAMASGVPIIAENRWGWREMIRHGQTGYLADREDDLVACAERLAHDEELRLSIARQARRSLEEELAEPTALGRAWRDLFAGLEAGP
jgi:hypothetical protein